jgi:hypothetical protein
MAISFDGVNKRIVLDSTEFSAAYLWSRWVEWFNLSDNSKWPLAMRQVGGDSLGSGLLIPPYIFLLNGWRIRPMESNHTLLLTGNIFVEGGGSPVVQTLGNYNVSTQYTVPVQAQGYATGGSDLSQVISLLNTLDTKMTGVDNKVTILQEDISLLVDIDSGNWEIVNNQMIFKNTDNIEILKFDLFNSVGIKSSRGITKRTRI